MIEDHGLTRRKVFYRNLAILGGSQKVVFYSHYKSNCLLARVDR